MLWYRFILYSCVVSTCDSEQHIYIYLYIMMILTQTFQTYTGEIYNYVCLYVRIMLDNGWLSLVICPLWELPLVVYFALSSDAFWTSMEAYQYWHRMGSEGVYFFQAPLLFCHPRSIGSLKPNLNPLQGMAKFLLVTMKISTSWMMTILSSSLWPREVNSFFFQIMGAFPT